MASIESSPYPLVFPVRDLPAGWRAPAPQAHAGHDWHSLRTAARALAGMQKEAIVADRAGQGWRMVCDEGPYLNGTDLAPFPLAFFCIGMAGSYLVELLALARARKLQPRGLQLLQDNRYAMEGSAVQGTMTGSALPVELGLVHDLAAERAVLQELLPDAVAASPAAALLRQKLDNSFSLCGDGHPLPVRRVRSAAAMAVPAEGIFDALHPAAADYPADIISKLQGATRATGVPGGAGSSLAEHQKRELHMRGTCLQREDGLLETTVELYQPLGSRFRFLSDPAGIRAPSPLAFLSAGVAFCYLTQIGRYCGIVRRPLTRYALVQDSCFSPAGASEGTGVAAACAPLVTHVSLDGAGSSEFAQTVVDMSEQTCFLHAACRSSVAVKIKSVSESN